MLSPTVEGERIAVWLIHYGSQNIVDAYLPREANGGKFERRHYLRVQYDILSGRWGSDPTIKLLCSNLHTFRQEQPIADLPKTFREAVVVARHFKIRYLWIDSLCIVQDSDEDWLRESAKMHEVYAHSACTISAAASTGPEGGLFRSRDAKDVHPAFVEVELPGALPKKFDLWD